MVDALKRARNHRVGAALLMVLVLIIIFVGFSTAVAIRSQQELRAVRTRSLENAPSTPHTRIHTKVAWKRSTPTRPGIREVWFPKRPCPATLRPATRRSGQSLQRRPGVFAPDNETWVPQGAVWLRATGQIEGTSAASGVSGLVGVAARFRPRFRSRAVR